MFIYTSYTYGIFCPLTLTLTLIWYFAIHIYLAFKIGFGFVYFDSIDDARRARDSALESGERNGDPPNSVLLDGRPVRIDYSLTQKPHSPTPGIYMSVRC